MSKVTIMIGLPGSGKSTWASQNRNNAKVCSADLYFMRTGKYEFNAAFLGEAHKQCLRQFCQAVQDDLPVLVDNTNTSLLALAPYMAVAAAYNCEIEVIYMDCDPETSAQRNTHGVSAATCQAMYGQLQALRRDWPTYWPKPTIVR